MDDQTQLAQDVPQDDQIVEEQADQAPAPEPQPEEAQVVEPEPVQEVQDVPTPPASENNQSENQVPQSSGQYDEEIKSDKIETKRKTFFMDLKANSMGRYVKISERSSGKRSTIIIPEENIQEFTDKIKGLFS